MKATNLKTLYLCDGKACRSQRNLETCYMHGGRCHHTVRENHSISKKDESALPTKFVLEDGWMVEKIDTAEFLRRLV